MKLRDKIASRLGYVPKVRAGSEPPSSQQKYVNISGVTNANVPVNTTTAMRASAVMACVRVLSDTLAQIPLVVYRRVSENGKERATDHPLYDILHNNPNSRLTSFEWRRLLQGHVALRGNGFCEIKWDRTEAGELVPLNPDRISIESENGEIVNYKVREEKGSVRDIRPDNMLHLMGLSRDGVVGINPIQEAAQSVGITLAADRFGASFFGNGAKASGVLSHPGVLSVKALQNLRSSVMERITGDNQNSPLILEEDMKWTQMTIAPEEAQFLETRKFQVNDIARIFRVPPHMIGDLDRATFSNIEQQSLEFVVYTMMPWIVMWEQRLTKSLIIDPRDDDIFIEFLLDGLLRGDSKQRSEALQIQFMNGVLNGDEWRAIENRNPLPDEAGQVFYRPLNLGIAGDDTQQEEAAPSNDNAEMFNALLHDASSRIARAELRAKAQNNFNKPKHESYVKKTLTPFGLSYCDGMLANGHTEADSHTERIYALLQEQRNAL